MSSRQEQPTYYCTKYALAGSPFRLTFRSYTPSDFAACYELCKCLFPVHYGLPFFESLLSPGRITVLVFHDKEVADLKSTENNGEGGDERKSPADSTESNDGKYKDTLSHLSDSNTTTEEKSRVSIVSQLIGIGAARMRWYSTQPSDCFWESLGLWHAYHQTHHTDGKKRGDSMTTVSKLNARPRCHQHRSTNFRPDNRQRPPESGPPVADTPPAVPPPCDCQKNWCSRARRTFYQELRQAHAARKALEPSCMSTLWTYLRGWFGSPQTSERKRSEAKPAEDAELYGGYVSALGVHPHYRRWGLGSAILQCLCELVWQRYRVPRIYLHTASSNTGARALYRRKGFTETHLIRNHYFFFGRRQDAVKLVKTYQEYQEELTSRQHSSANPPQPYDELSGLLSDAFGWKRKECTCSTGGVLPCCCSRGVSQYCKCVAEAHEQARNPDTPAPSAEELVPRSQYETTMPPSPRLRFDPRRELCSRSGNIHAQLYSERLQNVVIGEGNLRVCRLGYEEIRRSRSYSRLSQVIDPPDFPSSCAVCEWKAALETEQKV